MAGLATIAKPFTLQAGKDNWAYQTKKWTTLCATVGIIDKIATRTPGIEHPDLQNAILSWQTWIQSAGNCRHSLIAVIPERGSWRPPP